MKLTLTISIAASILLSCGPQQHSQEWLLKATSLTLKMQETTVEGKPAVDMMLCEGQKCINPLRDESGDHFHFTNYADTYNKKVKEEGKGSKIKMALFIVTMVATTTGAFLYIKSDYMRGKIAVAAKKIEELAKKLKKQGKSTEKIANLNQKLAKQRKIKDRYEAWDALVTPSYWTALGISGLGTSALAFTPGIAEDSRWQEYKRLLADLFIHGQEVRVTKDELVDLFAIIVKQVPAKVDVVVQGYLFGI